MSSAKNDDDAVKLSESSFNLLVTSVLGIPIAGLGIIIGLMTVMRERLGFSSEMIAAVVAGAFLLLFVSEAAVIYLLMQHARRGDKKSDDDDSRLNDEPRQLPEASAKRLDPAKTRDLVEPIPLVTEDTTRSLAAISRGESRTQ
ncbi:MAG: hypothetical protein M3384_02850 [Acidobacteriota bacterium]|nr:hypothetical protein [Acidobacteriota bacterium]